MHREFGMTFIYVTHDQEEAMAMSDKVAVLQNARLLQYGSPAEIYEQPRNRAVAEFVGAANVLDGTVVEVSADTVSVRLRGGQVLACGRPRHAVGRNEDALVALRCERFLLGESARSVPGGPLVGTVTECLYLGKSIEYVVAVPPYARPITVVDHGQLPQAIPVGASIEIAVRPEHARILPGESNT
jgi:ABC-type Fe3+/spermidine/putrescine transport system ATPase subunit